MSNKNHEKKVITFDTLIYLRSRKGREAQRERIFRLVKFLKNKGIFLNEYKFLYEYFNFFAEIDKDILPYYCTMSDRRVEASFLRFLQGLRKRFIEELGLVMKTRRKYDEVAKRKVTQVKFVPIDRLFKD